MNFGIPALISFASPLNNNNSIVSKVLIDAILWKTLWCFCGLICLKSHKHTHNSLSPLCLRILSDRHVRFREMPSTWFPNDKIFERATKRRSAVSLLLSKANFFWFCTAQFNETIMRCLKNITITPTERSNEWTYVWMYKWIDEWIQPKLLKFKKFYE